MPTYEYMCESCNHRFDEFQQMNDKELEECPECHENTLRRMFGPGGGVIFKGEGFYHTDYKMKEQNRGKDH